MGKQEYAVPEDLKAALADSAARMDSIADRMLQMELSAEGAHVMRNLCTMLYGEAYRLRKIVHAQQNPRSGDTHVRGNVCEEGRE